MPQVITLDNMLANEGKGWFPAILSNCTWNLSTIVPGDGAASSVLVTPAGTGECTLSTGSTNTPALVSTHKYYVSFRARFESAVNGTFDWYWPIAEPAAASGMTVNAAAGVWTRVSATFDRTSFTNGDYQCRVDYNNDDGGNKPFRFTSCMLFDLTAAFGAGKEPSKEWMDTYVTAFADSQTVHYYENLGELFTAIATAIRSKDGTTGEIFACDFPSRISALGGSSDPSPAPTYTITLGANVGSITANGQIPQSEKLSYYVSEGDTIVVTSTTFNANQNSMTFSHLPASVSFSKTTNNGTGTIAETSVTFTMPASNLTVQFTKKSGASA